MKTLIEVHLLQNFAPSNLNRDDTGAPKDALFGGTRRARISSQCFKRAMRQHFNSMIANGSLSDADVGVRTKRLLEPLVSALVSMGRPEASAREKALIALEALSLPVKDDGKNEYLLFFGKSEIQTIATIVDGNWDALVIAGETASEEKKATKSKKKGNVQVDPKLIKDLEKAIDGGKALDVALFGRMLADMPKANQDAACQVAHSISTHAIEREFDFYTAVDDLKPDDNAGADMLGTVEFNSACYYRYANIDYDKLVENLQGDKNLSQRGLKAVLEAFVIAMPTGKQNSFAAQNPPEFVAITVRHNSSPRNLANAFEAAVRIKNGESLTQKSVEKLLAKAQVLQSVYGGTEHTYILNLTDVSTDGFGHAVASLQEILDKTLAHFKD
jgi:CRISPR system Cascade subunit CasC